MRVSQMAANVVILALGLSSVAIGHPYTSWEEDGMSSDAHTHINSGTYDFRGQGAVEGYFAEDGSYVVAYGYFNSEGIWVQTEYIPGTVLAGGAIEGYTTVTGGGIVEIFGYEDGWDDASEPSIVRASVTTELASASVQGEDDLSWIGKRGKVADPSLGRLRDCWCATSIDDRKVPVYRTTSSSHGVAIHNIGGGMKTFDVERFHKGHWQVSWRDNAGEIAYGWAPLDRVACKKVYYY